MHKRAIVFAVVALALVFSCGAGAQVSGQPSDPVSGQASGQRSANAAASPAPTAAPEPKGPGAGTEHDLSGVWNALRFPNDLYNAVPADAAGHKEMPVMTAWGAEQFAAAKPSQGPHGVSLDKTNDRVYKCYPPGLPYIYVQLFPMEIMQSPKQIVELFEYDHFVRHIYMDGRTHPADFNPSYMGNSIGHWEGDTLVVDTVGLNGKAWLDRVGHPESDQMHVVERIHRVDATNMQLDLTFDDPKAYTSPWSAQMHFRLHPTWDIMEDICEDNFSFEGFEK